MKLKAAVLGLALMAMSTGVASAAGYWVGVTGGGAFPTGDFSDEASTGFNFGGTGTYMVNEMFGVGGDVVYHMWSGSDDLNAELEMLFGPGSEVKFSAIQATAHGVWMPAMTGAVKPHVKVGAGIYNVKAKFESPSGDADDSESKLGFNAGGGLGWAAGGNMMVGVNAAYHIVPAEESNADFFTVGLNLLWGGSTGN